MAAPIVIVEQDLELTFDVEHCVKWDDHRAHRQGIGKLPSTEAVDFVVLPTAEPQTFIEVKDYRGFRIPNKSKLTSGELARSVAQKVRDTIAGLYWASSREGLGGEELRAAIKAHSEHGPRLRVVLWLEEDRDDAQGATALAKQIELCLRPVHVAKVIVTSRKLEAQTQRPFAWLKVKSRSRRKGTAARG
jgi:hypothetical protein